MTVADLVSRQLGCDLLEELAEQDPDFDYINRMIDQGADLTATGRDGVTAFMIACSWGDKELVPKMLAHGAEVNARDKAGNTPLHLVVASGKYDIIRLLLEKGADAELKNDKGQTPIDCAQSWQEPDVADLLRKKSGELRAAREAKEQFNHAVTHGMPVEKPFSPLKPLKFKPK